MPFYSCNRYRMVVIIMLGLIAWQIYMLTRDKPSIQLTESNIIELEDDKFNKHIKDKVKARIYYEALCPDSKHFFVKHLGPVSKKLSDFVHITLVPYGKASTKEENGEYYFICQHGEEECYANKVHACAIDILKNSTLSVEVTECMIIDNMDADSALYRCAKQYNLDPEPIKICATHRLGSALLKKHGDDTSIINPKFIPTITLNGSKDNQRAILKNFLLEICKMIDMPLPPPCL
ncbi:GILT-like protein 1 [Aricia agestis]|uniref:GILT-like protein 1 n=1 Tax=Aricia agestis TaxID=91739 RepID=UPI001C20C36D|nr:GILT-like protein 1 [Aricia agestis]XP_041975454.1 GILT-like protein 1 [Aricia agestis]